MLASLSVSRLPPIDSLSNSASIDALYNSHVLSSIDFTRSVYVPLEQTTTKHPPLMSQILVPKRLHQKERRVAARLAVHSAPAAAGCARGER